MGGVFIGECAFELSGANLELRIFAPFCVEVHELYGGLSWTSGVSALNLCTPVEVANLTVEDETGQTKVECVAVCSLLVFTLILQHAVATELDVLHPSGQFNGSFLLMFGLYFFNFCQRFGIGGDGHCHQQCLPCQFLHCHTLSFLVVVWGQRYK